MDSRRFAPVSYETIQLLKSDAIPENTTKKQKWAMKMFREWFGIWRDQNNFSKEIEGLTKEELDLCLQFFIPSLRKLDGDPFPPRTLKEIVALVQHYYVHELKQVFSIFVDAEFVGTRDVLDAQMKQLARCGFVKPKKRAEVITREMENALWENGVLGIENPRQLLGTLAFYLGLHLGLRACSEHRALEFGQNNQLILKSEGEEEYLVYTEAFSKNRSYGLKQSRLEPKTVKIQSNKVNNDRCVVALYKNYISHRPEINGGQKCSAFYLTPLVKPKSILWYKSVPLGVHSIEKIVKNIMNEGGYDGFFTNTSLRRTARTRLMESGIPDKVARKVIGHMSMAEDVYISCASLEEDISKSLYGQTSNNCKNIVETKEDGIARQDKNGGEENKVQASGSGKTEETVSSEALNSSMEDFNRKANENPFQFHYKKSEKLVEFTFSVPLK